MQTARQRTDRPAPGGFTLIELILVMTILLVVLSVSAPMLTTFFRGRALDAEARRFLALTRYAQNRAVSEGMPMTLWIDPTQHKYGLEIQSGFVDTDVKAAEYMMERDLEIEVTASATVGTALTAAAKARKANGDERMIRFTPDGFIGEDNPDAVTIRQGNKDSVSIAPNRNRLNYAIQTNNVSGRR